MSDKLKFFLSFLDKKIYEVYMTATYDTLLSNRNLINMDFNRKTKINPGANRL